GSLSIFASHFESKKHKVSQRLKNIVSVENSYQFNNIASFNNFVQYFTDFKQNFRSKLLQLKSNNQSIIGITSPAKGVVLLNYCGIDNSIIDFIVDTTPNKQ